MPTLTNARQRHRRRERLKATFEVRWIWRRSHNWGNSYNRATVPARDSDRAPVKKALIQDGWAIALGTRCGFVWLVVKVYL